MLGYGLKIPSQEYEYLKVIDAQDKTCLIITLVHMRTGKIMKLHFYNYTVIKNARLKDAHLKECFVYGAKNCFAYKYFIVNKATFINPENNQCTIIGEPASW